MGVFMSLRALVVAAAFALAAGSAQAATRAAISLSVFSVSAYDDLVGGFGSRIVEDFEDLGPEGNRADGFSTKVGTFRTLGGTGGGATVTDLPGGPSGNFAGNDGKRLAVRDGNVHGRHSTTALLTGDASRDMFLDSNDTLGLEWRVEVGSAFTRLLLTLTDATDAAATMRIGVNGVTASFASLRSGGTRDGNVQLVLIDFGRAVSAATVRFENLPGRSGRTDDGFSVDDIAVDVGVVPLPAPAMLLIGGLAMLAFCRRRRPAA
jgi:hypothetical protein